MVPPDTPGTLSASAMQNPRMKLMRSSFALRMGAFRVVSWAPRRGGATRSLRLVQDNGRRAKDRGILRESYKGKGDGAALDTSCP